MSQKVHHVSHPLIVAFPFNKEQLSIILFKAHVAINPVARVPSSTCETSAHKGPQHLHKP